MFSEMSLRSEAAEGSEVALTDNMTTPSLILDVSFSAVKSCLIVTPYLC